jgi:DNA-binding MarR family transcriptional regulator
MSLLAEQLVEAPGSTAPRAGQVVDACDRAIRDIEAFKQQIDHLKRLQDDFCTQIHVEAEDALSRVTLRVLVHLSSTQSIAQRDVGVMARKLCMERRLLQQHLVRLRASGLAESDHGTHRLGHLFWTLTPRGRQYVLDHQLAATAGAARPWSMARARKVVTAVLK